MMSSRATPVDRFIKSVFLNKVAKRVEHHDRAKLTGEARNIACNKIEWSEIIARDA